MFHFKHSAGDVKFISDISSAFLLMRPSEPERVTDSTKSAWRVKVRKKAEQVLQRNVTLSSSTLFTKMLSKMPLN